MIAIYGKTTITGDGYLAVNDVATRLTVAGNLGQNMRYDIETNYTFIYGSAKSGNVRLYDEMIWDGNDDMTVIIPVLKGKTLYSEKSVDVDIIGSSDECRIAMIDSGKTRCVGVGTGEDVVIHDLQTCMTDYCIRKNTCMRVAV